MTALVPNPNSLANEQHPSWQGIYQNGCTTGDDGEDESNNHWGDSIATKSDNVIRIAFQNIQGLPINPYSDKHLQISTIIEQLQINSLGIAEINLNLSKLPSSQQWNERFKGILHKFTNHATNIHAQTTARTLFGGVAQINTGTLAHRAIAKGADPTGLGRWVWSKFTGRLGLSLRVISGYRPVNNRNSDGPLQVGNQQESYLLTKDDDRPARRAFLEDLDKEMQEWIQQSDLIVLCLDANENVRQGEIIQFIRKWGLIDAHQDKHPSTPTVATCPKNRSNIPIDGIWISPSIEVTAAGYSGFGEYPMGNTDHRLLWVDINIHSCFGFNPPQAHYRAPRRLTLKDPRVVKKYNKLLNNAYATHRLPQRALQLQQQLPTFDIIAQQEYEKLAELDFQCRQYAERRCRKLHMGKVPFSENLRKADDVVQLWMLLKKKRTGLRVSIKKIRRLMRSAQQPEALERSLSEIQINLKKHERNIKGSKRKAQMNATRSKND